MGKKSSPAPPDYRAAAEETAKSNREATTAQTWANRPTQIDPWGRVDWTSSQTIDPATGQAVTQWTQNTSLDPRLQQALDSQIAVQQGQSNIAQGLLGRVAQEYSTPMNWGQLTPWQNAPQGQYLQQTSNPYGWQVSPQNIDTSRMDTPQLQTGLNFGGVQDVNSAQQARQQAEQNIYQTAQSKLDPQWQKQQRDLETQLANKGITSGSQAYWDAMNNFAGQRSAAYDQARRSAIEAGGQQAQIQHGMDLAKRQQQVGEIGQQGQFYNQALGQAFGFGGTAREQQLAAQRALYEQQMGVGQYGRQGEQQAFEQAQIAGNQNYQQQMQSAAFANQMRQSQMQEAMQRRGFSLNEIQALLNGQQVNMPNFQSFNQAGNWGGTDYSGAANNQYQAALGASNAKNAQAGQTFGTIASSAAMMF